MKLSSLAALLASALALAAGLHFMDGGTSTHAVAPLHENAGGATGAAEGAAGHPRTATLPADTLAAAPQAVSAPMSDADWLAEIESMLAAGEPLGGNRAHIQAWCARQQHCARLAACAGCMKWLTGKLASMPAGSEMAQRTAALIAAAGDVDALKYLVERIKGLSDGDAASANSLTVALEQAQANHPQAAAYFASLVAAGLYSPGGLHLAELEETLIRAINTMEDQPLVGAYLADIYQHGTTESGRGRLLNIRNADMLSQVALDQYQLGNYSESQRALNALYALADDGRGTVLAALAAYSRKSGMDVNELADGFRAWSAAEPNPYAQAAYADILGSSASTYQDKVLAAAALGALAGRGGFQALQKLLDRGTDATTLAIVNQELLRPRGGFGNR